jgi:superfamily II helicase
MHVEHAMSLTNSCTQQILMLRALLSQGGAALFVVPYVALAEEKASYFKYVHLNLSVLNLQLVLIGVIQSYTVHCCTRWCSVRVCMCT